MDQLINYAFNPQRLSRGMFKDAIFSPLLENEIWKTTPSKLVESDKQFTFYVQAPAVDKENITIKIVEDRIVVNITADEHKVENDEKMHWNEWWSGTVSTGVSFPKGSIDYATTTASINDGVIVIKIPKVEEKKEDSNVVKIKIN